MLVTDVPATSIGPFGALSVTLRQFRLSDTIYWRKPGSRRSTTLSQGGSMALTKKL